MKKIGYLIILILLFIGIKSVNAYNFDNTIKIYDYAQVLTEKQENKLIENAKEYIEKYNIDMVIIAVRYYSYDNINDYIKDFYKINNFGIGNNKSGIILAIDSKNDDFGIKLFGEATTLYSESEIKSMISCIKKKDTYYSKLSSFIKYSNKYIKSNDSYYENSSFDKINWIYIILISVFIPTLLVIIILIKTRSKKPEAIEYFYTVDNLVINKREEKFITTHTKQFNKNNI